MTTDCHIHIGEFYDLYFEPVTIAKELISMGIDKWYVSSTTTCSPVFDFSKITKEIKAMLDYAPKQTVPNMWITPEMIKNSPDLSLYNTFPYGMIKIHPYSFSYSETLIEKVFEFAVNNSLPLLIHTGGRPEAEPLRFEKFIKDYPDVETILAHGRPIDQAYKIIKQYSNAYVDTAFMPINDINFLIEKGLKDKIIFGSDYPIDSYFHPKKNRKEAYINFLNQLKKLNII